MIEEVDFEIFLYISEEKYKIFVFDKKKLKNLYIEELKVHNEFISNEFNYLSKFLDENIYKIENLVGTFIQNIILIIRSKKNLDVNISIKKRYEKSVNQKYLENNLIEVKDLFRENYQDQNIMHMIITNYLINGVKHSSYINITNDDHLCLEVNFLSISNDLSNIFDELLKKFQIKIRKYMCGNYIEEFSDKKNDPLSLIAYKLRNGLNENEVALAPKNNKNKGFFEKFFELFN